MTELLLERKQAPHNLEAEQALLGSLLLNNQSYEHVSEFLRSEHFSSEVHGKIFRAISLLIERGETADPITLKGFFYGEKELEPVGGESYLIQLVSSVITICNVGDYGKLIYDFYLRRQLITLGESLVNEASTINIDDSAMKQIEKAESKLFSLASSDQWKNRITDFDRALVSVIQTAEIARKSSNNIVGVTTGLLDLDQHLGGLHKSDLIILAGRPSMGKTALATNIAYNAAFAELKKTSSGGKVLFFSLEMSSEQLVTRLLAQESNISSDRIRRGAIKENDIARFLEINKQLSNLQFFIDDTPALSVAAVRTRARRLKRIHSIDLIVIDYLQLLRTADERRYENRVQEVSEITRSLKALAKELNVPILALSQLSRAVELREDKRPQLADLRESGSIEQDADVVMFIYRSEYYESRQKPQEGTNEYKQWLEKVTSTYNIAELIIAKQRHGPIGTMKLFYDSAKTKFRNLSEDERSGQSTISTAA